MTLTQSRRLALIRADMAKWLALDVGAREWDTVFLLELLDLKSERIRELEKGRWAQAREAFERLVGLK